MYRLNPFIHIFKKNNISALYNTLSLSTLYFREDEYDEIINNPKKELIDTGYFVDENFKPIEYVSQFIPKNNKPQINIAYFLVSSGCNFNCKYCFIETRVNELSNTLMSKEIAKKGIELIERNAKQIKIIFYGGEPLLNFEVIKFVVNEIKKTDIKATYSIITNGSIMTDEIINFFKTHKFSVSVSLDGLEEANDRMRKDHNNKGTFQRVKKTLQKLKENEVNFGISCTISNANLNKPNEIFEILEEFDVKGFGYNLLTENNNVVISDDLKSLMVDNILLAADTIIEKKLIEDRVINRKLKPFVEKRNWTKDCAGYGHQFVITPKGEVGPCHGLWPDLMNDDTKTYFDLTVDYKGDITEHPIWKEWFARTPYNMPQCWSCFAIGLCGGGCAKNSLIRKGSIWEVDEDICILSKKSVEWAVWKYYDMVVNKKND